MSFNHTVDEASRHLQCLMSLQLRPDCLEEKVQSGVPSVVLVYLLKKTALWDSVVETLSNRWLHKSDTTLLEHLGVLLFSNHFPNRSA